MILLYDIDGVVADIDHRLHFLKDKNYDEFYSEDQLRADEEIIDGGSLIYVLMAGGAIGGDVLRVNAITGRPERTRETTEKWLNEHGIPVGFLFMRKDGDYRPSSIVKVELITEYFERRLQSENPAEESFLFVDDDPKNIKAVQEAFPNATCLVFGAKRLGEYDA